MVFLHYERKVNRFRKFNYSQASWYFVTICTKNKEMFFGAIVEGRMVLSHVGKIASKYLDEIPKHFPEIKIDDYILMPDHIHAIIVIQNINNIVGNNDRCSLQNNINCHHRNMELLPKIISQYKSSVSRNMRKEHNDFQFGWQRSFYDRIIRNEKEYYAIRQYIRDNPVNWEEEVDNLDV